MRLEATNRLSTQPQPNRRAQPTTTPNQSGHHDTIACVSTLTDQRQGTVASAAVHPATVPSRLWRTALHCTALRPRTRTRAFRPRNHHADTPSTAQQWRMQTTPDALQQAADAADAERPVASGPLLLPLLAHSTRLAVDPQCGTGAFETFHPVQAITPNTHGSQSEQWRCHAGGRAGCLDLRCTFFRSAPSCRETNHAPVARRTRSNGPSRTALRSKRRLRYEGSRWAGRVPVDEERCGCSLTMPLTRTVQSNTATVSSAWRPHPTRCRPLTPRCDPFPCPFQQLAPTHIHPSPAPVPLPLHLFRSLSELAESLRPTLPRSTSSSRLDRDSQEQRPQQRPLPSASVSQDSPSPPA